MSSLHVRKRRKLSADESENATQTAGDSLEQEAELDGSFARNFTTWDLETGYQNRKKQRQEAIESTRLPIKTSTGRLQASELAQEIPELNDSSDDLWDPSAPGTPPTEDSDQPTKDIQPELPIQDRVIKAKEELSKLAAQLSEDPEGSIRNLKGLANITSSNDAIITKLGLATQVQVFKDIIPSYRIRALTKDELKEKVSKDIRALRAFEQSLVSNYHNYVRNLNRLASPKHAHLSDEAADLASTALSCACSLITTAPHFNFRTELLQIVVNKLSAKTVDRAFLVCQEALQELFRKDDDGKPSLEAVALLVKMMKAKEYNVHERVLNTFLHIRLLSEFSHKASTTSIDKAHKPPNGSIDRTKRRQWEHRSKKQRKTIREEKAIEKELVEADATVGSEERDKQQGEALKLILGVYFRILKARTPTLIGATLEGLSRYAHLINQDLFGDVLESLKDIMQGPALTDGVPEEDSADPDANLDTKEAPQKDTRRSLLAVITAFTLLQGQDVAASASSLGIDLRVFISHLWQVILPACLDAEIEDSPKAATGTAPNDTTVPSISKVNIRTKIVLLLRSLHAVLLPANIRSVSAVRVAAFTKQLTAASLHLPEMSCQALLGVLVQILKAHRSKVIPMWFSEERRGDGVFNASSTDIESSNPFTTTCFENELLRLHYSPAVKEGVSVLEEMICKS